MKNICWGFVPAVPGCLFILSCLLAERYQLCNDTTEDQEVYSVRNTQSCILRCSRACIGIGVSGIQHLYKAKARQSLRTVLLSSLPLYNFPHTPQKKGFLSPCYIPEDLVCPTPPRRQVNFKAGSCWRINATSPQRLHVPISTIIRLCLQINEIIILILGFLSSLKKSIFFGTIKTNLNKLTGKQYV